MSTKSYLFRTNRLSRALAPATPRFFLSTKALQIRLQSTSTMAAMTAGPAQTEMSLPIRSTLEYTEKKDFSTRVAADNDIFLHQQHWDALLSASQLLPLHQHEIRPIAQQMDLVEAAASKEHFDKIILLVNHGEAAVKKNDTSGNPVLTGRGVGQVLNLSRRTANFCAEQTGLSPQLMVTAPLACSIQTAMHAFPYLSPAYAPEIAWICHSDLVENDQQHAASFPHLGARFPGIDFSLCQGEAGEHTPESMVESKSNLIRQSDRFWKWIQGREERVIVVSSHSTWLQSFCGFTLDYKPESQGMELFKPGEMRAVGINCD